MTEVQLDRYRDGETTVNVLVEVSFGRGGVERARRATEGTRVHPDGRRERLDGPDLERFLARHHGQGRRVV
jgi:hypothetical protein